MGGGNQAQIRSGKILLETPLHSYPAQHAVNKVLEFEFTGQQEKFRTDKTKVDHGDN